MCTDRHDDNDNDATQECRMSESVELFTNIATAMPPDEIKDAFIQTPDLQEFKIERFELANINSLNFYIHDILQDGVSSNNKKDGQAKSLGEYLRSKKIKVPESIIGDL